MVDDTSIILYLRAKGDLLVPFPVWTFQSIYPAGRRAEPVLTPHDAIDVTTTFDQALFLLLGFQAVAIITLDGLPFRSCTGHVFKKFLAEIERMTLPLWVRVSIVAPFDQM